MAIHALTKSGSGAGERGFSLIEIMVGVVIGMIAILVIYQVFAAAEGIKRNTTSVGDAQQSGLLSSFMLNIELSNASNGVADAMTDLATCPNTGSIATTFRPIPVLITDGVANSDSFTVNYSVAQRVVTPVTFTANAAAGAPYEVVSPNGFKPDDLILAISSAGDCVISRVTAVAPDPGSLNPADPLSGQVKITHTGAPISIDSEAVLLNLGPKSSGQRVTYDVSGGVLRSTALWDSSGQPNPQPTNPIASNVVMLKLMYGIDNGAGGVTWTSAVSGGLWDPPSVLAADNTKLRTLRAIRLGIVVQGEQYDEARKVAEPAPSWILFKPDINLTGTLQPGFRYRSYETIIPLRNPVWNS